MMSIETIRAMADEAAEKAARENMVPYVYWDEDEVSRRGNFPFPFLGDYVPHGWEVIDDLELFCDSSGFGTDDEPALSERQLRAKIIRTIRESTDTIGWGITQVGQFQLYVQGYRKLK